MELSNYISPSEFQDLCNGKGKVILKRVYKKTFVNSAMCMTLNEMTCRLFTFEVTIVHVLRILSLEKISDFYEM